MKEQSLEEFRKKKKEAKARMTAMQNLPYEVKVKRAERRAWEFVEKLDEMGLNAHVSVGGLDSITLLIFFEKDWAGSSGYFGLCTGRQEYSKSTFRAGYH